MCLHRSDYNLLKATLATLKIGIYSHNFQIHFKLVDVMMLTLHKELFKPVM